MSQRWPPIVGIESPCLKNKVKITVYITQSTADNPEKHSVIM